MRFAERDVQVEGWCGTWVCQIYIDAKPSGDEKQGFFLPAGTVARCMKKFLTASILSDYSDCAD